MKSNNTVKREGFTLVELLIVIVVIGVLSTMMIFSSTEAVTSAKANNVIVKMTQIKKAAIALYIDSLDYFTEKLAEGGSPQDKLTIARGIAGNILYKYLGNISSDKLKYISLAGDQPDGKHRIFAWYVKMDKPGGNRDSEIYDKKVRKKIAGRAQSVGIFEKLFGTSKTPRTYSGEDGQDMYLKIMDIPY